jgi:hypothetical protein
VKKSNNRHRRLLRPRRERPRRSRAAEQRDELASSHVAHGLTTIARRRTAMLQRARLPWRPLPSGGGGSDTLNKSPTG